MWPRASRLGCLPGPASARPERSISQRLNREAVPTERVALSPALWLDPDVRWLDGVHEAEGHDYLVRERYEELLWWLLMPSLLRLAGETAPDRTAANRAAVRTMSRTIEEAWRPPRPPAIAWICCWLRLPRKLPAMNMLHKQIQLLKPILLPMQRLPRASLHAATGTGRAGDRAAG